MEQVRIAFKMHWFKNKEDAIKKSERFGGIVRQFTIVVED